MVQVEMHEEISTEISGEMQGRTESNQQIQQSGWEWLDICKTGMMDVGSSVFKKNEDQTINNCECRQAGIVVK